MNLLHPGARVVDAATGERLTPRLIDAAAAAIDGERLVFLPMPTTVPAVARYLAALRAGKPVVLLDPGADHTALIRRYATDVVHPDLALLLTTSGVRAAFQTG